MKHLSILLGLFFLFSPSVFASDEELSHFSSLLAESFQAYDGVKDYKAVFLKREESKGVLGEQETLFIKFEKPFKIFLHWFDTHRKGLQVFYERGRHGGKLAIHQPGLLLGLAPVIFLEQSSPWVRKGSELYDIEDAGIGTFLEDFSEMVQKGIEEKKIDVKLSSTDEGTDADVSFPGTQQGGDYFAWRVEAFFDAKTKLPVRMRLYDWSGKVTGIYEYKDLRLNVGTEDTEFKKIAERALYRLFIPRLPSGETGSKVIQQNNFSARRAS